MLKTKAMALCKEHTELDVHGEDDGFATFLDKYLPAYTSTIFAKLSMDDISNEKQLCEVLTLSILFYKVQVFRIKNEVFDRMNTRTKFKKDDIKPIARYLSAWIVATHGDGDAGKIHFSEMSFNENVGRHVRDFMELERAEGQSCDR